jgi:Ala-tRNA(Pro) deacylase
MEVTMAIAQRLQDYLQASQVAYSLLRHPRAVTSQESARLAEVPDDHLAKGVVLKDAQGYLLLVLPANHHLRLHACRELLQRELELASEAELAELFPDCAPGAVPALGPAYGLETWMDEALATLARVYFEAGDHESLVQVSGEAFRTLLGPARCGWFSHPG